MAENNSSAPLKTAEGVTVPAFHQVAKLKLDDLLARGYQITGYAIEMPIEGSQPSRGFINSGGFVGWWIDNTTQAVAAQAAVAVPAGWRDFVMARLMQEGVIDHDGDGLYVCSGDARGLINACMSLHSATPALPATEDSSAGDLAHDTLRCAVGNCTFNGEVAQHAAGCQHSTQPSRAEVQAEPVAEVEIFERRGYSASLDRDALEKLPPGKYQLYTAPQAQPADAMDAWQAIGSLPTCDDLIWLYCQDTNTIDGPVAPHPMYEDSWTHWAYAQAPSTATIDAAMAAAQEGGDAAKEA